VSTAPRPTFFKVVPIRLEGAALEELRVQCFTRDRYICQECGCVVTRQVPEWHPIRADMAHILGRGAGGPDTIENVRTLCHKDHMLEHGGGKPCPPKPWNT
jgi:5-methylcytosine-specific restriction endonuclease McrA